MDDDEIRQLLDGATTIAVVGASTDPDKAAWRIPEQLLAAGFEVVPVHPSAEEVHGRKAYPTLADVPVPIDVVDVFRPSAEAAEVTRQAVEAGAAAVWLQLGITSDEARSVAEEAGIPFVEDLCMGQRIAALGISKPAG